MIKLIQNGLFGNNLFKVDNPIMVKRYNSCLEDIGLPKTKLRKFHIDGWGWSPEVAEEQKNRHYLSHGLANPYGIIISPEQKNSSIYMPSHSFDRQIHKMMFEQCLEQIRDITAICGLWFELDQKISAYRSPQDILMIDYINVVFYSVDRIMHAAQEQRALIREFYDVKQAWSKDDLRQKIIDSSKKYGDLRFHKFEIPNLPFSDITSFYTLAFEGVYVFKNTTADKPLLIFSNNDSKLSAETQHSHVEFNIEDPQLLSHLYSSNMISDATDVFEKQVVLLEIMKDYMLLKAALETSEKVGFNKLSRTQKKGLVNRLLTDGSLPDAYFDLESLISSINESADTKIPDQLRSYLLHPHGDLGIQQKFVVWQLLCNLFPVNPLLLYLFDKSKFYSEYQEWPEEMQLWVVDQIIKHKDIYNTLI